MCIFAKTYPLIIFHGCGRARSDRVCSKDIYYKIQAQSCWHNTPCITDNVEMDPLFLKVESVLTKAIIFLHLGTHFGGKQNNKQVMHVVKYTFPLRRLGGFREYGFCIRNQEG